MDISNGSGIRVSVFTQGCNIHCKGCFNQSLWDITKGKNWTEKETELLFKLLNKDYIKGLTWLGGEPTIWYKDIITINNMVKNLFPNKDIWLYTGHLIENVPKELINSVDIIVANPFIEEFKDINLSFRGSSNQKIYKVYKNKLIDVTKDY